MTTKHKGFSLHNFVFIQQRRGEICVPNFTPPANGAHLGSYYLAKSVILC